MGKKIKISLLILTGIGVLACAIPALANSTIGWGMYGSSPMVYQSGRTSFTTFLILLVMVTIIETFIFRSVLNITFLNALKISSLVNFFSTILGFILAISVFEPFIIFLFLVPIGFIFWWTKWLKLMPRWVALTTAITFFIGVLSPLIERLFDRPIGTFYIIVTMSFPLFIGFSTSLFTEGVAAHRLYKGENIWKAVLIGNIATYILLAIFFSFFAPNPGWGFYRVFAPESRVKGTLRSIGSSQLAFSETQEDGHYGTLEELHKVLYISKDYNLDNMLEFYQMTWSAGSRSTVDTEGISLGVTHTFTIVAYPLDRRPGYLNTFGVTEDQVVRVYNPDNPSNKFTSRDDPNVLSWDPIL